MTFVAQLPPKGELRGVSGYIGATPARLNGVRKTIERRQDQTSR